jgi:hypothetical protein
VQGRREALGSTGGNPGIAPRWSRDMKKIEDVKADLTRLRDEAKVQVELGRMEIRDEWNELETKWNRFLAEARVHECQTAFKRDPRSASKRDPFSDMMLVC